MAQVSWHSPLSASRILVPAGIVAIALSLLLVGSSRPSSANDQGDQNKDESIPVVALHGYDVTVFARGTQAWFGLSAVTARTVMPNQDAGAGVERCEALAQTELNHHGRSKRVHCGRRARRGRTDVPRDQDAYLNLRVAEPLRRRVVGPVPPRRPASTAGRHSSRGRES
jgi:hypothetical protein